MKKIILSGALLSASWLVVNLYVGSLDTGYTGFFYGTSYLFYSLLTGTIFCEALFEKKNYLMALITVAVKLPCFCLFVITVVKSEKSFMIAAIGGIIVLLPLSLTIVLKDYYFYKNPGR